MGVNLREFGEGSSGTHVGQVKNVAGFFIFPWKNFIWKFFCDKIAILGFWQINQPSSQTHNPSRFPSNHPSRIRFFTPIHQSYYNYHYHYLYCVSTSNTSTTIINITTIIIPFQPLRLYNSFQSTSWQLSISSHIDPIINYISNTAIDLHSAINIKLFYIYPPPTTTPPLHPLPPLPPHPNPNNP